MFKSPGAPGVAVLATIPARLSVGIADMETSMVGNEKVLTGGAVTSWVAGVVEVLLKKSTTLSR